MERFPELTRSHPQNTRNAHDEYNSTTLCDPQPYKKYIGAVIVALNILDQVNAAYRVDNPIAKQFPELFHGLGKTKGEYEIKLRPNASHIHYSQPEESPFPCGIKYKC